jgi:hypothetical protein
MDSVKWLERIVLASDPLPVIDNAYREIRKDHAGNLQQPDQPPIPVRTKPLARRTLSRA